MKTSKYLIALSFLAAVAGCNKNIEPTLPAPENLVTIRAVLPDDDALKGPELVTLLSWSWSAGDKLTVIGETTEIFSIKPGFTAKEAEFVGAAVKGSSFTILYPGESALTTDWSTQVQKGNNNMSHLRYEAVLEEVDDYTSFSFSPAWAGEHGGTLKQVGVMKLTVTPPAGVTTVTSLSLSADDPVFYSGNGEETVKELTLQLQDITLSEGDPLTAWLMTSWNEATVPAGTALYVGLNTGDKQLSRDVLLSKESVIKTGYVNLFTLSGDSGWADETINAHYAGGKGTKASPWIIQTVDQLGFVAGDLASDAIRYYKLDADISLDGVDFASISCDEKRMIDFDGAGHTISKPSVSLFSSLDGSVKNLVIDGATIDGGSNITGALVGKTASTMEAVVENVDLKNSTVSAAAYTGGLIGEVDGKLTISGADVTDTDVTGTLCGGILGFANNLTLMDECTYVGGTVTSSARYAGALVGSCGKFATVISNCLAKNAVVTSTADRIGGAIGQLAQGAKAERCKVENVAVTGKQNVGGFVGVCYSAVSTSSVSGGSVSCTDASGAAQMGGFVGYPENATITDCYTTAPVNGGSRSHVGGFIGRCMGGNTITNCYEVSTVSGTGANTGAFIGYYEVATTSVTKCIAWDGTLNFCGAVKDDVSDEKVTGNYIGTEGTVSSQAQSLGWSADVWDFSDDTPKLK